MREENIYEELGEKIYVSLEIFMLSLSYTGKRKMSIKLDQILPKNCEIHNVRNFS